MLKRAVVMGVLVVLAGCGSSQTEEPEEQPGTTTSSLAPETTPAATTIPTTEAPPPTTTTTTVVDRSGELAGNWFACEFVEEPGEEPTDGCATFDDDGLLFEPEGGVLLIIERVGGNERDCLFDNRGTCFEADLPEIEITAEVLAAWTLDGTTIAVVTPDCVGTIEWEPRDSFSVFRPGDANGCEVLEIDSNATEQARAGGVYFGRYEGASDIVS